jgi:hypothetical protein
MNPTVATTVFGSETDKRMVLNNSQWAGKIQEGTDWNRIRIGCRLAVDDSGAGLGAAIFILGVCSNPVTGLPGGLLTPGVTTYDHTLGWYFNLPVRNATSPVCYTVSPLSSGLWRPPLLFTDGGNSSNMTRVVASPNTVRQGMFIDVWKGSPNFTLGVAGLNATTGPGFIDLPEDRFDQALVLPGLADIERFLDATVTSYGGSTPATLMAVDEATNGFFNAIYCCWSGTAASIHLSEIKYCILA